MAVARSERNFFLQLVGCATESLVASRLADRSSHISASDARHLEVDYPPSNTFPSTRHPFGCRHVVAGMATSLDMRRVYAIPDASSQRFILRDIIVFTANKPSH